MTAKTLDDGAKLATLYYSGQLIPYNGYVTEHVWFLRAIENEADTGKFISAIVRRKYGRKYIRLDFGRGDELVIVAGRQPKYISHNIVKRPGVTSHTPKFSTPEEWITDFESFFQRLLSAGVQVIADYRGEGLGHAPLLLGSGGRRTSRSPRSSPPTPPIITLDEIYAEGAPATVILDKYERNPKARQACLNHYGVTCRICEFDFAARYPKIGEGFIEVHHLTPLSEIGEDHTVDPVKDLLPVCPNCHAMLHRTRPPLTPDALRALLGGSAVDADGSAAVMANGSAADTDELDIPF